MLPVFQQSFTVIISRFCSVAQIVWRVAVHAGFACDHGHIAGGGGFEECVDAAGVDRAKAGQRCGAVRQGQIERLICRAAGVTWIVEPCFFWESVGVQPIDQLFAPAGDDACLGVVHVCVNKSGADQGVAVVCYFGLRMGRAQDRAIADGCDSVAVDQDATLAVMNRMARPIVD